MSEIRGRAPSPAELFLEEVTAAFDEGDNVSFLYSPLDDFIEQRKRDALTADLGVAGFLADFARDASERRLAVKRWEEGRSLPTATPEKTELIASKTPPHLVVNDEAIGGIHVKSAKRFKIDIVSNDIMAEIASLLPRKIDAYQYEQGYAEDTVEVPGLGKVEVSMYDSNGIFKAINQIRTGDFRIWNCRQTGLWYNERLIDNSNPTEIDLGSGGFKIRLYDDESGVYIERNGHEEAFGGNYVGRKPESDWHPIQDEAIIWLAENILFPLREAEKPVEQATLPPETKPYPHELIGPIFTFIEMKDYERVIRIKENPESAFPDERFAISPGLRLIPLSVGKNIPREAHYGFIYAKPGEISEDTDLTTINEIGKENRRTDRLLGSNHGFAQIQPKSAKGIYVAEWDEYTRFRERTFSEDHKYLTDAEADEQFAVVARTMIPASKYDGSFKDPIILIGRELELDEVVALFPAPEDENIKY